MLTTNIFAIRAPCLAAYLAFGSLQSAVAQQSPEADRVSVAAEDYTEPKMLKVAIPEFPATERWKESDGWVEVQFMVDPKGKPYELEVVLTSGSKAFDKVALRAIERSRFASATLGGRPIDASLTVPFRFDHENGRAVGKAFRRGFEDFAKAIQANDKVVASDFLAKLEPRNPYEKSLFAMAQFTYAHTWGTEDQQLQYLRMAIAGLDAPVYLSKQTFVSALMSLVPLEAQARNYGEALSAFKVLKSQNVDAESLVKYQALADRIETLRTDPRPYSVSGSMTTGTWKHELFRNKFHINVTSGHVSQIKLYCEIKFVLFAFDPALEYTIDKKYGACSMIAYGDGGTTLDLIQ